MALADKLDTLVGFWAINEKPTGSGDPYQLRRAALGVIRIILENDVRLPLSRCVEFAYGRALEQQIDHWNLFELDGGDLDTTETNADVIAIGSAPNWSLVRSKRFFALFGAKRNPERDEEIFTLGGRSSPQPLPLISELSENLLSFFADRLKVHLREKGTRHDLIDAVFALGGQDDLALIVKRVDALSEFLKTDDGANLLAGVKRAANILAIEEKKDKTTYTGEGDGSLLAEPAERALDAAIAKVKFDTKAAIDVENFTGAMRSLAELRGPVDQFFDKVTVNAEDAALRQNRLKLAVRDPRRDPHRRRLLQDRRLAAPYHQTSSRAWHGIHASLRECNERGAHADAKHERN